MTNYSRKRKHKIYVGTKLVGEISKGVFSKVVEASKHFLSNPDAIAFAVSSLDQAEREDVKRLEVTDAETGWTYRTDLDNFKRHSFEVERGGFEPQRALRLERWTVIGGQRRRSRSRKAAAANSIAWQPAARKKNLTATPADVDAAQEKSAPLQPDFFPEMLLGIEIKHRRPAKRARKESPWMN